MKKLVCTLMALFLVACAEDGKNGQNGAPGTSGQDGEDAVLMYNVTLPKGACMEIAPEIWAENIHSGEVFDVYYNDQCTDAQGEYCDNVATSYGHSGHLGNTEPGSSSVCWVDYYQFSGVRLDNGDIKVYVLEF